MSDHRLFMARGLDLALSGSGHVHPNPLVGAVVVHHGKVVGEGYHQAFGGPHAEVFAIASVKDPSVLGDATLYVTLEPCSHHGKTPPCTDLILKSGIRKVVIASTDPNPLVSGSGIRKLRAAGVEVIENILNEEARKLNRRFFTFHEKKRPYVILKWAETADGFIGRYGKKLMISNNSSRILVHKWRTEEHSIMVGTQTVLNDNPSLDARLWKGQNPVRVVVDLDLKLPAGLVVFRNEGQVVVLNLTREEVRGNIRYVKVRGGNKLPTSALQALYHCGLVSVLIEGGKKLLDSFLESNCWDECHVFRSNSVFGGDVPAPLHPSEVISLHEMNGDQLISYTNQSK